MTPKAPVQRRPSQVWHGLADAAATNFALRHLTSVGAKILASRAAARARFGEAQAREERLGVIGAYFALAVVGGMIDALRQ